MRIETFWNYLVVTTGYGRFFQVSVFVTSDELRKVSRLFWTFLVKKFEKDKGEVVYDSSFDSA